MIRTCAHHTIHPRVPQDTFDVLQIGNTTICKHWDLQFLSPYLDQSRSQVRVDLFDAFDDVEVTGTTELLVLLFGATVHCEDLT